MGPQVGSSTPEVEGMDSNEQYLSNHVALLPEDVHEGEGLHGAAGGGLRPRGGGHGQ
jgi:hypothetical protein